MYIFFYLLVLNTIIICNDGRLEQQADTLLYLYNILYNNTYYLYWAFPTRKTVHGRKKNQEWKIIQLRSGVMIHL